MKYVQNVFGISSKYVQKKKKEKGFHIKELNNASHTDNIKWVGAKELKIGFKKKILL